MSTSKGAGRAGRAAEQAAEFAEFVRATGTRLYRTALLLTGDHFLAEDLTQAAYAKTYASWGRVSRADNPVAYTRATLVNTYLSHRRLLRSAELPIDVVPDVADHEADPALRLDLLAALQLLPTLDRAILTARYWEDRSVAETAADLGLTEGAVRTRAKRALDRLRPHLDHLAPAPLSSEGTTP